MSDGILEAVGLITIIMLIVFVMSIIGALIGALMGLVVQLTPILNTLVENGFEALGANAKGNIPSIGAVVGFVSGMFAGFIRNTKEVKVVLKQKSEAKMEQEHG